MARQVNLAQNHLNQQLYSFAKIVCSPDVAPKVLSSLTEGQCFAWSFIHSYMHATGQLRWWYKMLRALSCWDGGQRGLENKIKIQEKSTPLKVWLNEILNYVLHYQNDYELPIAYPKNKCRRQSTIFEKNNPFFKSANGDQLYYYRSLSSKNLALPYLLNEEAFQSDAILLMSIHSVYSSSSHACAIRYDSKEELWCLYDPNKKRGEFRYKNKAKFIAFLFDKYGTYLNFYGASLDPENDAVFKQFDNYCIDKAFKNFEAYPVGSPVRNPVLCILEDAPVTFLSAMREFSQYPTQFGTKLQQALRLKVTGLKLIRQMFKTSPESFYILLEIAESKKEFMTPVFMKLCSNDLMQDVIVRRPESLITLMSIAPRDQKRETLRLGLTVILSQDKIHGLRLIRALCSALERPDRTFDQWVGPKVLPLLLKLIQSHNSLESRLVAGKLSDYLTQGLADISILPETKHNILCYRRYANTLDRLNAHCQPEKLSVAATLTTYGILGASRDLALPLDGRGVYINIGI